MSTPVPRSEAVAPPVARPLRRWLGLIGLVVVGVLAIEAAVLGLLSLNKREKPPAGIVFSNPEVIRELMHMTREQPRDHDWPVRLGMALIEDGHFLSAVEYLETALNREAPEIASRRLLGLALRSLDRNSEALEQWDRLASLDPQELRVHLERCRELVSLGKPDEAATALSRIPLDGSGFPTLHHESGPTAGLEEIAALHAQMGDLARAQTLIERVVAREPSRVSSRALLGRIRLEQGAAGEAVPHLRLAHRRDPANAGVALLYARALRAENLPGSGAEIRGLLEKVVASGQAPGAVHFELAQLYERAREHEKAGRAYIQAEQAGVRPVLSLDRAARCFLAADLLEDAHYTRGRFYRAMGQPEKAIQAHSELLKMHDTCQSGYMHIAQVQASMGKGNASLATLKKAFDLGDPTPALLAAAADAHHKLGNVREEEALWQRFIKIDPENADVAYQHLAVIASRKGDLDASEAHFRKSIELRPDADVYRQQLATILQQRRSDPAKLNEAIEHLEAAVRLARMDPASHYNLGVAYRHAGRNQEAIWALRHAIDLDPGDGRPYSVLGQVLTAEGQAREGKKILELARRYQEFHRAWEALRARVRGNPRDVEAHRRLAQFYERTGAEVDACAAYQSVLRLAPGDRQAATRLTELNTRRSRATAGDWAELASGS